MTSLRAHRKTPCKACPFRRNSGPGWLGGSSPERMIASIMAEVPMPCHLSLNYEDKRCLEKFAKEETGVLCAGGLITPANMHKLPRDRRMPQLKPSPAVFSWPKEFIEHHRALHGSWSKEEDRAGKVIGGLLLRGMPAGMALHAGDEERKRTMPKRDESDLIAAIDQAVEHIDESEFAGSTVPQSQTVEYYEGIIEHLRGRISTIRSEMNEEEADDDDEGDE